MRTKKIFLNMICDILPYLIIGVIGIVKMDVLINYIGDVGRLLSNHKPNNILCLLSSNGLLRSRYL